MLRTTLTAFFVMAVVSSALAEQHDVRSCKVLEAGPYPYNAEVVVENDPSVFSVVMQGGRLRTLLIEFGGA